MRDDQFIKSLSQNLEAKVSVVPSQRPLFLWLIFALVVLAFGLAMHSIRADAGQMLEKGSFYLELFSALSVGIIAAGSALTLRIPGSRAPLKVLGTTLAIWLVSLVWHSMVMKEVGMAFNLRTESGCFSSILAFSVLPAALLVYLVRRGASTEPQLALTLVAVAVTAASAAVLPMACGNDGLIHLFLGHAAPLFVLGAIAWASGRKILKW